MPDWKDPGDYHFTQDLTSELWAWQFLRRNPEYRKDYQWFIETWKALEADYGKAPNRDFNRWKQDPRAYVAGNWMGAISSEDKSCATAEEEKILIECGMGSKWGFYKFPLSPDIEFPDIPGQLLWREVEFEVRQGDDLPQAQEIDLRFDLRLPFKKQLNSARRLLLAKQKSAHQAGLLFNVGTLTRLLRRLDATIENQHVIVDTLYLGNEENYHADSHTLGSLLFNDYKKLIVAIIAS